MGPDRKAQRYMQGFPTQPRGICALFHIAVSDARKLECVPVN